MAEPGVPVPLTGAMGAEPAADLGSASMRMGLEKPAPFRLGSSTDSTGMVGRFSAISGPLLWALVTWVMIAKLGFATTVGQGAAVLSLLAMVIVCWWILRGVDDKPRDWRALATR